MNRLLLKHCFTALCLVLVVSCHPAGCYGPKSFGYNTKGVATSNLFGIYTLDEAQVPILDSNGFTNHSGSIALNSDMTFQFSKVPCIMCYKAETNVYSSTAGKWRVVKRSTIWVVEVYDMDFQSMCCQFATLTFPILGEKTPNGIELAMNEDVGMWVKMKKVTNAPTQNSLP